MQNKSLPYVLATSLFISAFSVSFLVQAQASSDLPLSGSIEEWLTPEQKNKLNQRDHNNQIYMIKKAMKVAKIIMKNKNKKIISNN